MHYAVGSETYDLRSVPVLQSPQVAGGFVYNISLCKQLECGSYICQTGSGLTFGLGTVFSVDSTSKYDAVFEYAKGEPCVNGPRSSSVTVLCGDRNLFVNVTESPTCRYTFFITSPNACPSNLRQNLLALH
jgi:hypothetical protein